MADSESFSRIALIIPLLILRSSLMAADDGKPLAAVHISADGTHFVRGDSDAPFRLMGLNYDHDADGRLLEDYWHTEWDRVENDFRDMQSLGERGKNSFAVR